MASEALAVRTQILANAKIMLKPDVTQQNTSKGNGKASISTSNGHDTTNAARNASQATLLSPHDHHDLDVVVFGHGEKHNAEYTAAVMWGLTPAIQGASAPTTDAALRRLLLATCEMLHSYIPRIGDHQRVIHGGGVFNEDLISEEINAARKMSV